MLLLWNCRNCGEQLARMTVQAGDARLAALTSQAGKDIIQYDYAGNVLVRLLCEECLEAQRVATESEFVFLRGPELH